MRYLYHLTEGNRGPVTFEQLQELAKAGTIDNMTPVLAEGAREWSRWLFIKDTPPTAAPAPQAAPPTPAPVAAPTPAPKPSPAPQKKAAPQPGATPAPKAEAKPAPSPAPAPKPEAKSEAAPEPVETPEPESAPATEPAAKPVPDSAPAPTPAVDSAPAAEQPDTQSFSLSALMAELNLKKLIPAGVSAVVTLLSLLAACVWTLIAHDTEKEYAQLQDMAAEHEQSRQSLDNLSASRQQVQAETLKLNEDYRRMQETLKLTQEESGRLAKGPYISEAEAKQLKDEQAKAARLKEQEQKL